MSINIWPGGHTVSLWLYIYILRSSYFCSIWTLCVSWFSSNQFIMLLAWFAEHQLVHWHQKKIIVHHVPKSIRYHETIGKSVMTGRLHWLLSDYTFILFILLLYDLRFEHPVCHESLLTSLQVYIYLCICIMYIYTYVYIYLYTHIYVCT